jgi:hypothetical protein
MNVFYKGVTVDFKSPVQSRITLTYTPGTTVRANGFDTDPDRECGAGINFCRTLADALRWAKGGTVVTVRPVGVVVDAGSKLRAEAVEVLSVVDLRGADLYGADLSRANLYGANLYGADLSGATRS